MPTISAHAADWRAAAVTHDDAGLGWAIFSCEFF